MAEPTAGVMGNKPVFYVSYNYSIEGVRGAGECPKGKVAFKPKGDSNLYPASSYCVLPKRLYDVPPDGTKPFSDKTPLKWGSRVKTPSGQEGLFVGSHCPHTELGAIGIYLDKTHRVACMEESALTLVRPPVEDRVAVGAHVYAKVKTTFLDQAVIVTASAVVVGIHSKQKTASVIVDMGIEGAKKVPLEGLSTLQSTEGE